MELLYFYLQDIKRVPPTGVNFGGELLFEYHSEHRELLIKNNPIYLRDFFNDDQDQNAKASISNISAIVGQNGAGKSTFLDMIMANLPHGTLGIKTPLIVAIKEPKGITVYYWDRLIEEPFNQEFSEIQFKPFAPTKVNTKLISSQELEITEYPKISVFSDIDFVFFSNIYDHTSEVQADGLINLSTNFLSGVPERYSENEPETMRMATDEPNDKDEFRYQEIRRQIDLINSFQYEELIPFALPDMLVVSLRFNFGVKYTRDHKQEIDYRDTKEIYYDLSKMFEAELENLKSLKERIKHNFIGAAVFNFLKETTSSYTQYISINDFIDIRKKNNGPSSFYDTIMYFLSNIALNDTFYPSDSETNDRSKTLQQSLFGQKSSKLMLFIDMVKKLKIKEANIGGQDGRSLALYIKHDDRSFLNFYNVYRESYIDQPYLNFTWRNLSSGEKALLSIYSRFYSLINNTLLRRRALLKKHLIIILDEPDAYLHPAWQKQLVDSLQRFLRTIYAKDYNGDQRTIQIFFTTNNPLSITDLPHNNVILLKRDDDQLTITDFSDSKRTFAANIFDLYTDSFFLSDGYTGSFAVKKINQVFEDLNSQKRLEPNRKEDIKKIIQLIGEPMIKNKLIEMYHQKEVLDNNYESRLKRLEDQIFKNDSDQKK
jgi:ABC-type multidrug transport system ATPase subunit